MMKSINFDNYAYQPFSSSRFAASRESPPDSGGFATSASGSNSYKIKKLEENEEPSIPQPPPSTKSFGSTLSTEQQYALELFRQRKNIFIIAAPTPSEYAKSYGQEKRICLLL